MTAKPLTAPFPYFGGKSRAAALIWPRLGDPSGYVEPFAGSAAVLLARPELKGRRVETLNDMDGWLVNAWRAIQHAPNEVAAYAHGPVTEIDYHARLAWLTDRRTPDLVAWLEGNPENCDPKAAGWWLYVLACGIGDPFGGGPWRVVDGYLRDSRELPHLGNAGQGVSRELPHLGNAGRGVSRELPHLGDAGRGVSRELPHLGNAGQGVSRSLPHLGDAGQGLVDYLACLADRLQRVRITCGDWRRVVQPSVTRAGAGGDGSRAVFLDPPYSTSGDIYVHGDNNISAEVREWCATSADPTMRVILCGYDNEHDDLLTLGWTVTVGKSTGAGYSKRADNGQRERLWLSPACLGTHEQADLFGSTA